MSYVLRSLAVSSWSSALIVIAPLDRSVDAQSLAFTVQPSQAVAGSPINPAVEVSILDNRGRVDRQATNSVSLNLAANPGGAALAGALTTNAVRGVATFSNVWLDRSAAGYTLQATSVGFVSSTSTLFSIVAGPATRTAFGPQQSQVLAGVPFSPRVSVRIEDAYGNLVTNASNQVTVAFANNPTGASLLGTLTVSANQGTAVFSDLLITVVGTAYALGANSTGLAASTGASFAVLPGLPANLGLLTQPSKVEAAAIISPAVQVRIQDAYGNPTSAGTNTVGVALSGGSAGAVLSGITAVDAQSGIATFADLRIDRAGTAYTLAFTSNGLTGVSSSAFDIIGGTPAALAFFPQPPLVPGYCYSFSSPIWPYTTYTGCIPASEEIVDVVAGTHLPTFEVRVLNASGGLTDATGVPITITLAANGAGGVLSGALAALSVNGSAQFSSLWLTKAYWQPYKIAAASGHLTSASYNRQFRIVPAPAVKLVFTTPWKSAYEMGEPINVAVEFRDSFNNTAPAPSGASTGTVQINTGVSGAQLYPVSTVSFDYNGRGQRPVLIDLPGIGYRLAVRAGGSSTGAGPAFNLIATPSRITSGGNHTCMLTINSRIFCWGGNSAGQLGVGVSPTSTKRPVPVSPFVAWADVDASRNSATCAVHAGTKKPYCWGLDVALAGTRTWTPREIPVAAGVDLSDPNSITTAMIAAGDNHACYSWVRSNSYIGNPVGEHVACWGSNTSGATGAGLTSGQLSSATIASVPADRYLGVTAGAKHTCAWTSSFSGYCWGSDVNEQLGNGNGGNTNLPVLIAGGLRWRQLAAGTEFTCGLEDATGRVHCWGLNTSGQLGSGNTTGTYFTIPNLTFTAVSAGFEHACGITNTPANGVYCWGSNHSGQIGTGITGGTSGPFQIKIAGVAMTARSVSAGFMHTCAVTLTNEIFCWGANGYGQLGLGDNADRSVPTKLVFP